MDLNLDREQEDLVDTARRFLAQRFPLTEVDGEMAHHHDHEELLRQVAELGWPALAVPSEHGGADGTLVELALLAEELGRAGLTCSMTASTALVALPLVAADDARYAQTLSGICEGAIVATMPLLREGVADEWSEHAAVGVRDGEGWVLRGAYTLVPFAEQAHVFLVDAELADRGRSLVLVPADRVAVRPQSVIGGEPRAAVVFDGVRVTADEVVDVDPSRVPGVVERALLTATVLQCAHAVGACEAALQLSVKWAIDREQFGRQIGSFQSVSNRCADMRLGIDAARLLTWEAAWSLAEHRSEAAEFVSVAKAYLTDIGDMVVFNSHQVHGAMGFSTEYPLHVFTRSIKAFRVTLGSGASHLERVAAAIGL
ncbi:acyl-CoA dehydrogenase family protein [Rhodococcus sp. T7]|uniref:acyl-CoA dehydrogenase family protein n=1 Tax=Rhodococcus sp. T7 TaxID=627444 RepID=UPI00135C3792|nr:acyl-CoA dehydrogenase family protein [Rhodococcus sp. T7]KAF0957124.1 Caffeyl-CoA reductase-Etf complex subunit CarC [Rhodococcus sp. T7]KAF0958849.1 Caffeyl-CoA reductase-Etf complex subunit CarC [Rhodococcus sp. T7]